MTNRLCRPGVAFLAILVGGALIRVIFAPGIAGDDDMALAYNALGLLHGGWHVPTSNYAADYGMIVPLAAVFRIFGVGIYQLSAYPLLLSLAGLYIVYRIGTLLFDAPTGLLAAFILAIFPMSVEFSTLSFPDQPQGVVLGAAFLCALNSSRSPRHELLWASAAGFFWAYAYYIKIDAFFMAFVFLLAMGLGFIGWRQIVLIGMVTGALVGVELLVFARLAGNPFLHAALERQAANEVLSPTMNYRNLLTYPKAMFLTPYEGGLHFFLLLGAVGYAANKRDRPTMMLVGWILIFMIWLMFGVDPFGAAVRLKPQVPRYLLDFCVPMSVLIGWFLCSLYRRGMRIVSWALVAMTAMIAFTFMQFNRLNFEASTATIVATKAVLKRNWFPLYTDQQSFGIVKFVLWDYPQRHEVHQAQYHNFLTGTTTFASIPGRHAYLLINQDYARDLKRRNLVTAISPGQFGMIARLVMSVDNPLPASSYLILRGMAAIAGLAHVPSISAKVEDTARSVLQPGDAQIFALRREP